MTDAPVRARAVFGSDLAELRRMSAWFRGFAATESLPEDQALDLELCVNELAENVVRYAYPPGASGEIRLELAKRGADVTVVVEDDGRPFDPLGVAPRPAPRDLASLPVGGWGIALVRSLADDVSYERRGGTNRFTIVSRPRNAGSGRPD
jgi:serine/threonine-protein kinase RsbW